MILTTIFIQLSVFFVGCNGDEDSRQGLVGNDSDFYGTWSTGAGSFTGGDSIKFLADGSCDFFWSHSSNVLFNGTWDRTINSTNGEYILVITVGEKATTYYYNFFNKYTTLRLREESSTDYIFLRKEFLYFQFRI